MTGESHICLSIAVLETVFSGRPCQVFVRGSFFFFFFAWGVQQSIDLGIECGAILKTYLSRRHQRVWIITAMIPEHARQLSSSSFSYGHRAVIVFQNSKVYRITQKWFSAFSIHGRLFIDEFYGLLLAVYFIKSTFLQFSVQIRLHFNLKNCLT